VLNLHFNKEHTELNFNLQYFIRKI